MIVFDSISITGLLNTIISIVNVEEGTWSVLGPESIIEPDPVVLLVLESQSEHPECHLESVA